MQDKLEKCIKIVYNNWKHEQQQVHETHPDDEALACFLEGRLPKEENEKVKAHLLGCNNCMEAVTLVLKARTQESRDVPAELATRVKNLVEAQKTPFLNIALRCKERLLELVHTSGDILLGQELVPAPLLRSRSIKDFKDEVTILKDFKEIRVEVKVENKQEGQFNLIIVVKQKQTQKALKDLRIALFKEDVELESSLSDKGAVIFEHVLLGTYMIEVSSIQQKLASIALDIRT